MDGVPDGPEARILRAPCIEISGVADQFEIPHLMIVFSLPNNISPSLIYFIEHSRVLYERLKLACM